MNACMLAYTFYESDNRVRRYAETLARRGDHVDAIVLGQRGQRRREVIEGVHVHRIQERIRDEQNPLSHLRKLLAFVVRAAWHVTRMHARYHYDVIHAHSVPDFIVFAAGLARLTGARLILDIHDVVPELYASKFAVGQDSLIFRLLLWEEKLSIWFSDRVIIANHVWLNRVVERSGRPDKCIAILNYPDPAIFYRRPPRQKEADTFTMCYPGTLSPHQGVDLVISAMARMRDDIPHLRFVVIGAGSEEEHLRAMARAHGILDRVAFKGRLPLERVAEAMSAVDLGVEPKRNDSFAGDALSTKIPEFMAMGVPVLASDTRVHKYYFSDEAVEYFESDNPGDLASKITGLVRNAKRREEMREAGRMFVAANNWSVRKHEYLDVVDALVGYQYGRTASEHEHTAL